MSLINEALRKAQSQRAQNPGLHGDSNTGNQQVNYVDQPKRFGIMIGLGLFIVVLLGLIAGLVFILLSQNTTPANSQTTDIEIKTPASATNSESSFMANPAEKVAETTEPSKSELTEITPEVAEPPVIAAEPNQEIIDWLNQSVVSGVRITSSSSKVLLNNKGFSPGESVNTSLGLEVFKIEAKRITLIDANGVEYVKLF